MPATRLGEEVGEAVGSFAATGSLDRLDLSNALTRGESDFAPSWLGFSIMAVKWALRLDSSSEVLPLASLPRSTSMTR